MTHVPYQGSVPALTDLVAGHIQVLFVDIGPSLELIRAGKARVLGITSAEPAAAAPEIPPLAKVGVPGFDTTAWQMIVAPARTPQPILDKLNAEINAIVKTAEVTKQFVDLGMIPIGKGSLGGARRLCKIRNRALGQGDPRRRPRRIAIVREWQGTR